MSMKKTVWKSRLPERKEDPAFEALNASIETDVRLLEYEIDATRAHARALHGAGIYSEDEYSLVCSGLGRIKEEAETGGLNVLEYEDVHTLVESRLTELAGAAGAKIQTARSRNEQTVTNQRLFMKEAIAELMHAVRGLQSAVHKRAEAAMDVLMPGYTHARPAQPIRFAYYMMSFFFGLERDRERLGGALARTDRSPAGSGALAGATFGIDRGRLADDLGFSGVLRNSLDAISDRDTHMELLSVLAILMVRLSRIAEDLILWSSPAYGYVELGETHCTSSSLMPQKKNPDGLELVRGKAGRVVSGLVSLLITCKGLPTGYQKDLQEDKEPLFDAVDTTLLCLEVFRGIVKEMRVSREKAEAAIPQECMATDAADALVEKGVPFREAYGVIAQKIGEAQEMPLPSAEESVERRTSTGGTARKAVLEQMEIAKKILEG
jgi:argininosuccinate lyase